MAPRSNWKGYLKLSLVSAAVAIYPATSTSEKVRFNTLNRATGNRLKRQMVDAVTEEIVESEDQVKGYAVSKGQYVMVEDDEIAGIAIESTHTIDIDRFVRKATIDDRYRDTPYYLAPDDRVGQEAFAVIRDAMARKKMVGIARVVMARRERVMMLEPSAAPPNVVNLMDALRRSLETRNGKGKPAAKPAAAKPTARPKRKATKG
jgi:DNA end-binding protein Ku